MLYDEILSPLISEDMPAEDEGDGTGTPAKEETEDEGTEEKTDEVSEEI